MSIRNELKQRILKYETIHGLYKIPVGILLIYVSVTNIPYLQATLQLEFVIHDMAFFLGVKSLIEGLHNACHNPIKKEARKVIERDKYIANHYLSNAPKK